MSPRIIPTAPGPWWAEDAGGGGLRILEVAVRTWRGQADGLCVDDEGTTDVEDPGIVWLAPASPPDEVERLRAEVDHLLALVCHARGIIGDHLPAYEVWLGEADAALSPATTDGGAS